LEYVSIHLYESDLPSALDADPQTVSARTCEAIALAYARNLQTLEYFEIDGYQGVIQTRFWRVIRDKREECREKLVRVRELDEEDGMNAMNWFDWKL
jgi:hypothetical protein